MDYKLKNVNDEELWVYTEDGYCIIQSEYSETHDYWLGKQELEKLIEALTNIKEEIYRK